MPSSPGSPGQLVAATVPVGRMRAPDDIAHAAVFLMTNRQTTGAVLEVSGGEPLVEPVEVR
jgi:NAD(P)-dependent dehydrogenase (short-subunit alcohol dehydrogenase family)